jgi:hypothetical protein
VLELVRFGFRKLWEWRSFIVRVAAAGDELTRRPAGSEKMHLDAT